MGQQRDYSDLDRAPRRVATDRTAVAPRPVTGLSIAALIVGILVIPAALMPFFGIVAAIIGILLGIFALLRANKNGSPRAYAIGGLVLSILGMAAAIIFTSAGMKAIEGCETLRGEEFTNCIKDNASN